MKIAVTGKGGVGKTTIAALLARSLKDQGQPVILIDADPDMNLADTLALPPATRLVPIVECRELIAERTGTQPGAGAPLFKLNPQVADIPSRYWVDYQGIKLLVMGTIKRGGGGCACPENAFIKTLLAHLLLNQNEWVIVDMEAGIEHLGRGTAMGVDLMLVVVEPSATSLATARRIKALARDIGIRQLRVLANKVRDENERAFIRSQAADFELAGFIDYSPEIARLNREGLSVFDEHGKLAGQLADILAGLAPATAG